MNNTDMAVMRTCEGVIVDPR